MPRTYTRKTTSEAELRRLVGEGLNFKQIAEMLGRGARDVRVCASLLGIRSPWQGARGGGLVDADMVLTRIAKGEVATHIAKDMGVSHAAVHLALKRKGYPTTPAEYLRSKTAA